MAPVQPKFRTAYGVRVAQQISFPADGRTKQAHKDETDINKILRQYMKTGNINHLNLHGSQYGFATGDDFLESMNIVTKANEMFLDLPSEVRTRFDNNPEQFLDFVQNPENLEELRKLGLAHPETVDPPPTYVQVVEAPSAE